MAIKRGWLLLISSLLLLVGCTNYDGKTLSYMLKKEGFKEVDEIIVLDGSTGEAVTFMHEEVALFLAAIGDIVLTEDPNQQQRDGFKYAITFKRGSESMTISNNFIDAKYNVTEPDLAATIEAFLNNLP